MATIKRFEDLECWQEARKLVNMIYSAIKANSEFQRDFRLVGHYTAAGITVMNNICGRILPTFDQGISLFPKHCSGLFGYVNAKQISKAHFDKLDSLAFKLENGLLQLVESLERKRDKGQWIDYLVVKQSNAVYGND